MVGKPRKISKEYKGLTTPEAILQAAENLAGSDGPSGMKIREIARRVGIEPASIYNHFKGLSGILTALVRKSQEEFQELLVLEEELSGEQAIRTLNRRSTDYLAARKGIVSLTLTDFAEANSPSRSAFNDNEEVIVRGLDLEAELFRRYLGLTELSRAKLGQIAVSRRSMILVQLSLTWLNGNEVDEQRAQEIADLVSDFLLGLQSRY